jgi:hypothetical protein
MGVREAVTRDPIVKPLKYHFTCNPPADSDPMARTIKGGLGSVSLSLNSIKVCSLS